MDKKKMKLPLLAGGTIVIVVILLLWSSSLKKPKTASTPATPAQQEQSAPEEKTSTLAFADFDDTHNPLSGNRTAASNDSADDLNPYGNYPSPSFVSSSGDTLIYQGGIYQRVGYVEIETKPDTIIVQGKKYIELR